MALTTGTFLPNNETKRKKMLKHEIIVELCARRIKAQHDIIRHRWNFVDIQQYQ